MRKNNILNKKGLSLLEVIAVVIISGILLAFGAISIGNIISSAEDSKYENDAALIINSCEVFLTTNEDTDTCLLSDVEGTLNSSFSKYDDTKTVVTFDGTNYIITLYEVGATAPILDGYYKGKE